MRVKLVVNEPTLFRPTAKQIVGDRAVGRAQERGGPFEAARQQVRVRRLTESAAKLAAEVRARQPAARARSATVSGSA